MDQSCWCSKFPHIEVTAFHRSHPKRVIPGDPVLGSLGANEDLQILQLDSWGFLMVDFVWFTRMAQQNKKTRLVDHFLYSSPLFASYYTAGQEMGEDYHSESLLCAVTEHEILGFKLVWVPLADFVGKWLMRAMMPCFWASTMSSYSQSWSVAAWSVLLETLDPYPPYYRPIP